MSALLARLQQELIGARKAREADRTLLLSTIVSDIKAREIDLTRPLTDDDALEVVRKGIKKRRESVEAYRAGGRDELAAKEAAEVAILEAYLPPQANPDDIRAAAREAIVAGATNLGAVMGKVMARFKGIADGAVISQIVREELAKQG
jgi:uncharacterized protein YqeY